MCKVPIVRGTQFPYRWSDTTKNKQSSLNDFTSGICNEASTYPIYGTSTPPAPSMGIIFFNFRILSPRDMAND